MKKLLSVLSMFLLTTGVPSTVFSCSTINEKENSKFEVGKWRESLDAAYSNNNYNSIIVAPKAKITQLIKDDKTSKSIYSNQIRNIFGSKFVASEQKKFNDWFDNTDIKVKFLAGIYEQEISLKDSKDDESLNNPNFINKIGPKSATLELIVAENNRTDSISFKVNLYSEEYKFLNSTEDSYSVKIDDFFKGVSPDKINNRYNADDDKLISVSQGFYNQYKVQDQKTEDIDIFNKLVVGSVEYNKNNFEWVIFAQDLFRDISTIAKLSNVVTYNSTFLGKFLNGYDSETSSIVNLSDWIFNKLNNGDLLLKFIPNKDKVITSLNDLKLSNKDGSKSIGFQQNWDI